MQVFGIYTTWTVIASLLNFVIALHYVGDVDMDTACKVALSLLLVIVVCWFAIENTLLDFMVRFIVTQYLGESRCENVVSKES